MINPTEKDIGRRVVYRGHGGEVEAGTITSIRHPDKTFVNYGRGSTSALTKNEQLDWACPINEVLQPGTSRSDFNYRRGPPNGLALYCRDPGCAIKGKHPLHD